MKITHLLAATALFISGASFANDPSMVSGTVSAIDRAASFGSTGKRASEGVYYGAVHGSWLTAAIVTAVGVVVGTIETAVKSEKIDYITIHTDDGRSASYAFPASDERGIDVGDKVMVVTQNGKREIFGYAKD